MRLRFFGLAALLFVAPALGGCDSTSPSSMPESSPAPDLAPTPDLNAGSTCLQIITCASGCAGGAACEKACGDKGAPASQKLYQDLFTCAYAACLVAGDSGTAPCTSNTDTGTACQMCVSTNAQGAGCAKQLAACLSG